MSTYLIIGAGITGMTAGATLSNAGHTAEVVDRSTLIGGKVLEYCCKATDSCARCGVCVAHEQLSGSLAAPGVTTHLGAALDTVTNTGNKVSAHITQKLPAVDYQSCLRCGACIEACPEGCITEYARAELVQYAIDHERCLLHNGTACSACVDACPVSAIRGGSSVVKKTLTADAALIATGHEPFNPVGKPRYGYARSDRVITGAELEEILSHEYHYIDPEESVAFIQCVGSRDPVLGRNYCSAVCCSYALRLARVLKTRRPKADVVIYYIDIQNFDKEFTKLRAELAELGVQFSRGLPFRVDEKADGRLRLMLEDAAGEARIVEHDRVVLSVGMGPAEGATELADQFGLDSGTFGFFSVGAPNVYVSGTCKEPQSIPDSIAAARATALEMQRGGQRAAGAGVAGVGPGKGEGG